MIPDWTVGSTSTGCRFSVFTHTQRKGLELMSWDDEVLGVWVGSEAGSKMISGTVGPG